MRTGYTAIGVILLAILSGCAMSPSSIPIGRWEGEGTYIMQKRSGEGQWKTYTNRYQTGTLIRRRCISGQDMLVVTVVSKHGGDEQFNGKDIHLILTLVKSQSVPDGSVLYDTHVNVRPVDNGVLREPTEDEVDDVLRHSAVLPARCYRSDGSIVLQAEYSPRTKMKPPPFEEIFTFTGSQLIKKGHYDDLGRKEETTIDWTETLRKVR